MEKLLHERLRECSSDFIDSSIAKALANEIELYYIPRPRFEDGAPVRLGDIVESDEGGVTVTNLQCSIIGHVEDDDRFDGRFNLKQPLKRPTPKVLDTDGVEINSGDKLWELKTGHLFRVKSIKGRGIYVSKDGCDSVHFRDPKCFTHNEMDSLEKLRDDLYRKDDWHEMTRDDLGALLMSVCDRLTAIIERDA